MCVCVCLPNPFHWPEATQVQFPRGMKWNNEFRIFLLIDWLLYQG